MRSERFARIVAVAMLSLALFILIRPPARGDDEAAPAASPTAPPHPAHFKNNCSQPIWIADFGAGFDVVPSDWELAPACGPDAPGACPTGKCDGGACTCTTPGPKSPDCMGATCSPAHRCVTAEDLSIPWNFSGRFWPRTGCTGSGSSFKCVTGDCGALDCNTTKRTANNATLWEMTLTGFSSLNGGSDNYDLSLVSGYNIPVEVQAEPPADTPGWKPKTAYVNGQPPPHPPPPQSVIVGPSSSNDYMWRLNEVGPTASATSGTTMPKFADALLSTAGDPVGSTNPPLLWSTTSSICQTGACRSDLLATCPSALRVLDPASSCTKPADCHGAPCAAGGKCVVACETAINYCLGPSADQTVCTAQNKGFFACLNSVTAEKDPFGNPINLESANAGVPVCFTANDCPPGTKCVLPPNFKDTAFKWPAGAGLCVPGNGTITQNGNCPGMKDGTKCPTANFTFPFPDYVCETLTNDGSGNDLSVCVPPVTQAASADAAFGSLVWNADNFTPSAPTLHCTGDSHCKAGQYCLETTVSRFPASGTPQAQAVRECAPPDTAADCQCNTVKHCATDADCTAGTKCQDSAGLRCGAADKGNCLCQLDATYTGTCGATNANWTAAINSIRSGNQNFLETFKAACPAAYSYQFDDQASDWSCNSTADKVVSYTVTFCGTGGKGAVPPGVHMGRHRRARSLD